MIRRTPQARITNQGVNPVGEGKAALAAGAAVTNAAILYRNAAKAARKRGAVPLKDEVARARAGILFSPAAAGHPPWLKWRVSLGEPPRPDSPIPPAQTCLGVFQASKHLGFALSQGNQPLTLAGETLKRRSGSGLP